jgi:polysaccharide deactylase WbmS-like protein
MDDVVLTIDIDWAPDFTIDFVAEQLISRQVRATWFVTHMSPAIARLKQYSDLFELGIHPNFLSGSTHGDTPEAVLRHCMTLVPDASSVRTHLLVQSTLLLRQFLAQTKIMTDVSLFLPGAPCICPVEWFSQRRTLLRIPYFWADDFEMERNLPCWRLTPHLGVGDGLKVFAFHPIHVYLNSSDIEVYQTLKHRVPKISEASPHVLNAYIQTGEGTCTLFKEVIAHLAAHGRSVCIQDIYNQWRDLRNSPQE